MLRYLKKETSNFWVCIQYTSPLALQIASVLHREASVVDADGVLQKRCPSYRVQIRISPIHPRSGVVDGGRRHLVVIHVFRLCKRVKVISQTANNHFHYLDLPPAHE